MVANCMENGFMSSSCFVKVVMAITPTPEIKIPKLVEATSKEIKRGSGKRFFTKAKNFEMKRSSKGI